MEGGVRLLAPGIGEDPAPSGFHLWLTHRGRMAPAVKVYVALDPAHQTLPVRPDVCLRRIASRASVRSFSGLPPSPRTSGIFLRQLHYRT